MLAHPRYSILPQPDDASCGPTCLHSVYGYYGDRISLEDVLSGVEMNPTGGTLACQLGRHALRRGYRATLYTYNLMIFDPTWFGGGVDLPEKLQAQARAKSDGRLSLATEGYLDYLRLGGQILFEDLNSKLLRRYLDRHVPVMAGLSATPADNERKPGEAAAYFRQGRENRNEDMDMKLKSLKEQVVVLTGATSGIGLITARRMAAKGARMVLAARSENALRELVTEIEQAGGQAIHVVADVGQEEDVRAVAAAAVSNFGHFDTWINNAGVSIFGRIQDTAMEDMRHLMETDFWGVVYGSLEAVKHLKQHGGAIINLGSVVSERVAHMQGMYSTAKFAVKGFTDALRMELESEGAPISVTLVQPAAMDTPFALNAKNLTGREFQLPPPVYNPELVAGGIMDVAQNPRRDITVGGGGRMFTLAEQLSPSLTDKMMESDAFAGIQMKDRPDPNPRRNGLEHPTEWLAERGNYEGHVMNHSIYTSAKLHPVLSTLAFVGLGLVAARLLTGVATEQETPVTVDDPVLAGSI